MASTVEAKWFTGKEDEASVVVEVAFNSKAARQTGHLNGASTIAIQIQFKSKLIPRKRSIDLVFDKLGWPHAKMKRESEYAC